MEMSVETSVPFFRPSLSRAERREVLAVLESGWLTTGPRVRTFEEQFAQAVGARHAVALSSCTAALHLALESLGLQPGDAVLVPTMTFAATAEVVRYMGALPVLVDCLPDSLQIDLDDAERKVQVLRSGRRVAGLPLGPRVVGIMPVHVGGVMLDIDAVHRFAVRHGLWVVEDAAHAFPAAWRAGATAPWQRCGQGTAEVTCFSFYANKTITTGEGGMAVTDDAVRARRIRQMSLHGLSQGAWERYGRSGQWDYAIEAPGYKYNLTDLAAAIGIHQLARAERLRLAREAIARRYLARLAGHPCFELPQAPDDRLHAWHLFPIRLRLDRLDLDRAAFIDTLSAAGVRCSVHWRPLHCHPYYREHFGWMAGDLPVASRTWPRLVSLPLFAAMTEAEINRVIDVVLTTCDAHAIDALHQHRVPA